MLEILKKLVTKEKLTAYAVSGALFFAGAMYGVNNDEVKKQICEGFEVQKKTE